MNQTAPALLIALLAVGCFDTLEPRVVVDPESLPALESFDDTDWRSVLARHVDEEGQVDYPGLVANRIELDRFCALLATVGPRSRPELFPTREDRLAYYLNAYNALVLFNVIERYPLASVHDVKVDFFYLTRFRLDGEKINLYDLEHEIVRAEFGEPRIHFALNCASRGCPKLPAEPFVAGRLEAEFERETVRFLNEERNVAIEGQDLVLSEIFSWFSEDFPPDPVAWIRRYRSDLPAEPEVRFRPWDWELNER